MDREALQALREYEAIEKVSNVWLEIHCKRQLLDSEDAEFLSRIAEIRTRLVRLGSMLRRDPDFPDDRRVVPLIDRAIDKLDDIATAALIGRPR